MFTKRLYGNIKNGVLGRNNAKGKDALSKSSNSRYSRTQLVDTSDSDVNNVTFPYLRPSDNAVLLQCYNSVLNRTIDNGISMNDLDQLQNELEKLLSACAVRNRLLCSEFDLIDRTEDRHEKKGKFFDKPSSPKHRKLDKESKYSKETKPAYKLVKNVDGDVPKVEMPKVVLPKNDTKSKFWLAMDPFCANVSRDDVAFLKDLIHECSKEVDINIPELGQHYIEKWNIDTQEQDPNELSRAGRSKGNTSAFLEENCNKLTSSDFPRKPMNNAGMCLDTRLRNELIELGILESNDNAKPIVQDDEILQEIKHCQDKLRTLNEHNKIELNRLLNLVNKDLNRQEVSQKLDQVDNKITEIYNKLLTANPKEKDALEWEAIRFIQLQKELHNESTEIMD